MQEPAFVGFPAVCVRLEALEPCLLNSLLYLLPWSEPGGKLPLMMGFGSVGCTGGGGRLCCSNTGSQLRALLAALGPWGWRRKDMHLWVFDAGNGISRGHAGITAFGSLP